MTQKPMNIAVSGAAGLVGSAVSRRLTAAGHSVTTITRKAPSGYQDTMRWDSRTGLANPDRLESMDAVIHLAGENIAGGRWTSAMKAKIRDSRVEGTRQLVRGLASVERRPRVLICASAIGYYGDRGDEILTEESAAGEDFLAGVCRDWETEANAARDLGMRVVNLRIGVVLSRHGGALAKMLTPFRLCAGGIIGHGRQYMSWIGREDLSRIIEFCLNNDQITGPVNAVSPHPLTNHDFTKTLGQVLRRPTVMPMPRLIVKLVFGEMGDALLLSSSRVTPNRLTKAGFTFDHPDLADCLRYELASPK